MNRLLNFSIPRKHCSTPNQGSMTRKSSSSTRTKAISGGTSSETLIRFKSMSKHLLSLISHSHFCTAHFSRNASPSVSDLYSYETIRSDDSKRFNTVSLDGHGNLPSLAFAHGLGVGSKSKPVIKHFLNGLLLFCHFDGVTTSYIVCNPTTQKYKTLPTGWISKAPHHAYLAFDPSKSPHYKVVLISLHTSQRYCVDVYSSHDASWDYVFVEDKYFYSEGVFCNGAIHWLSDENGLLRFDLDAKEMIAIPYPTNPKILTFEKILYFGECGGHLVLVQSPSSFPMGLGILELDKDYSGWSVKCWVNLRRLRSEFPEMASVGYKFPGFRVLYVLKGEKEKDFVVFLAIPGRIISYNLKCRTWDVLPGLRPIRSYIGGAYPFVETQFPV